jgi:hypothetical protein
MIISNERTNKLKILIRNLSNLNFINDVIIIDKKHLIFHQENSGQNQMEYFIGNNLVSNNNILNFKENINNNKFLSEKYSFKYCHLICQAKEIACSNIFENSTGVALHSLSRDFLFDDSVIYPQLTVDDFYLGDMHNNNDGALKHILTTLEKLDLLYLIPKLNIKYMEKSRKNGDLDIKIGSSSYEKYIVSINNFMEAVNLCSTREFLSGNSGDLKYFYNASAVLNQRLVLFADSFVAFHLNIWGSFFKEVIYIRNAFIFEDVIFSLKPDVVVTSNTERYLLNVPKGNYKRPFFLSLLKKGIMKSAFDDYTYNFITDLFSMDKSSFIRKVDLKYKPEKFGNA